MIDLSAQLGAPRDEAPISTMARGLMGSEILKIASEIRALEATGVKTCNLTVGDFKPSEFPIPAALNEAIAAALKKGETNYPPSDGMPDLRNAAKRIYERSFGLSYPLEGVVVAGGARPLLYCAYRAVVDPGDSVVFPVPSWNNHHYCHLLGAKPVAVPTSPEHGFMPTVDELRPHLATARLLTLCSPQNPTGTMIRAEALREISQLVVDENRRREAEGRRPLIFLYDQIYWVLTFGGAKHHTPVELVPEVAKYTMFVDGISKSFAATGLRVGWGVGPPSIIGRVKDLLGHVGAWAPRPEQVATAKFLEDQPAVETYLAEMRQRAGERLDALHRGLTAMADRGIPVRVIAPQGAIYLSVQFDLIGKGGLQTNNDIRRLLLEKAAFAVVPFGAFGYPGDTGWVRCSVGATSVKEIEEALPRVEAAIRAALA